VTRKLALIVVAVVALAAAGVAGAYGLKRITLKPGHCTTLKVVRGSKTIKTKVCAKKVKPKTVTVAPSPIGKTFSGNGDETLAPITLPHGVTAHWTSAADSYGDNIFSVSSSPNDTNIVDFGNGNSSTSGTSYIPAGTYTLQVIASGAWTLSF
jgi:hypothetical protein